jgi:hypothetical protein
MIYQNMYRLFAETLDEMLSSVFVINDSNVMKEGVTTEHSHS